MAVSPGSKSQDTDMDRQDTDMCYLFTSAEVKPAMSEDYNPLILPSTGHIGDYPSPIGGPRRLTCLGLPRDLVLGRLSHLNLLGDPPVQGSQEVYMPWSAQGPNSQETNLPQPTQNLISRKLSHLSLPGDLPPYLGMPSSQAATVLGRISFRKTPPLRKSTHKNRRRPINFFFFSSLSSLSFRWEITNPLPNRYPWDASLITGRCSTL